MKQSTSFIFNIVLGLAVLIFFSCSKDESNPMVPIVSPTDISSYQSGVMISGNFTGVIRNTNGQVLAGVEVRLENETRTSNEQGRFVFDAVLVDSHRAYITAQLDGHFIGSRVLRPDAEGLTRVDIVLIPMTILGSVESSVGGSVSAPDGSTVELSANSVSYENGAPYDGSVQIAIHYLDPESQGYLSEMPGDFTAFEAAGAFGTLTSYGMAAFELLSASMEPLNITDGMVATITLPLSTAQMITAEPTMALWYFDEVQGIWQEQGQAVLTDGHYVGQVTHFSFWNADAFADGIYLSGRLISLENQLPLAFHLVELDLMDGLSLGADYSNVNGYFGGMAPNDRVIRINYYGKCDEVVHTELIGPFSLDENLGDIILDVELDNVILMEGQLEGCNTDQLASGYLWLEYNGHIYDAIYESDGSFQVYVEDCGAESVEVIFQNADETSIALISVFPNVEVVDLGLLQFCDAELPLEYLTVDLDGDLHVMTGVSYTPNEISGSRNVGLESSTVTFSHIDPGFSLGEYTTDNVNDFEFRILSSSTATPVEATTSAGNESITFTITHEAAALGDYVEGTFSGAVYVYESDSDEGNSFNDVPISGTFRLVRDW